MEEAGPSGPPAKKARTSDIINLFDLFSETDTVEKTILFPQKHNLLPKKVNCPKCGIIIDKIDCRAKKGSNLRLEFRCRKRTCRIEISARRNTWFDKSKLSLRKSLVLVYCFVRKFDFNTAIRETSGRFCGGEVTGTETVSDIYSYCREVCVESLYSGKDVKKIGGQNFTVEVDEAKFGKRKYNRGRLVEGQWVLGGICRETKEAFFVAVEDRSGETLCGIIERYVKKGSIIHTDCWAGYNKLEELGYTHLTVNHSENFVDPQRGACTNTIESTWWALKRSLPSSHTRKENFVHHLAEEYIWRRKQTDSQCLFTAFLKDIGSVYGGQ